MTSHIHYPIKTENTPSHTPHKKATAEANFLFPHQDKVATTKVKLKTKKSHLSGSWLLLLPY